MGALLSGFAGAAMGGLLGYLVWEAFSLRKRLSLLEVEMEGLRRRIGGSEGERAGQVPEGEGCAVPGGPTDQEETVLPVRESAPGEEGLQEWQPDWIENPSGPPSTGRPPGDAGEVRGAGLADSLNRFLTGGSLLVKTGIVVLFFGVSFLVKYAADRDLLPIELRLAGAAMGGLVLLGVGWRLGRVKPAYAHALQGGGVGVLYLTIFAAFRLYHLLGPVPAFSFLVAVSVLSALLAVIQDSRSLAVLGASGGFLAPVLASTGAGSHVVLFGYYGLLNLGIAVIAWFRDWRILNLAGFAFTFVIGLSWGWRWYRPEYFASTEPFLVLFFLIYILIALFSSLRRSDEPGGRLDATLVFGTPVAVFALQAMLVEPYRFGLAWSALVLGLFYASLALALLRLKPRASRDLSEAFLAFGLIFVTLAIPLALENRWTSAAWALEGAAILWAGIRQGRRAARAFGILLQFGAGAAFLADLHVAAGELPVANGQFLGCALMALTGMFSAWSLHHRRDEVSAGEAAFGHLLLGWGLIWWLAGGLSEIARHVSADHAFGAVLAFLALSALAFELAGKRLGWPAMAWPVMALLPMLYLCALAAAAKGLHPLAGGGWFGWATAFPICYLLLYRNECRDPRLMGILHAATFWLLTGVLTLEAAWRLDQWQAASQVWPLAAFGLVPALGVLLLAGRGEHLPWPTARRMDAYLSMGAAPVALFAWLWLLYTNLSSSGDPAPLRYLPFINPLDLTTVSVLAAVALLERRLRERYPEAMGRNDSRRLFLSSVSATLFIWLNGVVVRTVHHWGGVPFSRPELYQSLLLQATLSIFWSLLALCAMLYATRRGGRTVWFAGAALLGAVLLKLFMVDLSGTGTVARIVSFVVVGVLLLIIGYFAPVPPRSPEEDTP